MQDGLGNTITGSLAITSSQAISSSFATTASFALNAGSTVSTASLLTTASAANNVITFTKGDSSQFTVTVATGSAVTVNTGSLLVTASISNATTTFSKGDGSTFSITANNVVNATSASYSVTADTATSASFATSAATATSSSFATNANTATSSSFATSAASALNSTSASFASTASLALSVSTSISTQNLQHNVLFVDTSGPGTVQVDAGLRYNPNTNLLTTTSSFALNATSASFATNATSAATASFLPSTTNLNITSISASTAVFQSASIGYLQTITGSVVNIGDAFIVLNTSDATRYAGIKIEDSGSGTPTNYTASFQFDSQTNDWFYEYSGSDPTNFGVTMFGPEYTTIGSPTYLTNNRLSKGNGGHHLNDSTITDNGTNVTFTTPIAGTAISASTGFNGNLTGTASFATSASFAPTAPTFPFTGSARITGSLTITGSLGVTGSINTGLSNNITAGTFNAIIGGTGNNNGGEYAAIIGAINSTINSGNTNSFIGGGQGNKIQGSAYRSGMFGGFDNTINSTGGGDSVMIAGGGANVAGGEFGGIVAGVSNTATHRASVIVGGEGLTTRAPRTVYTPNLDVTGSLTVTGSIVTGEPGNSVTGNRSAVIGGGVGGNNTVTGVNSVIAGGQINSITVNNSFVGGGRNSRINGGDYGSIVGGGDNRISGGDGGFIGAGNSNLLSSNNAAIIGGTNNTVNQVRSVIIGGNGMTTTAADTVYVPNLVVSGSQVISGSLRGEVKALSIASNTASLDCSTDNFFTLTLVNGTGTNLNPSNIQPGQTINVRISQPATTGSGQITFPSSIRQVSGSLYTPTQGANTQDIITFIAFDSSSLYLSNIKNFVAST